MAKQSSDNENLFDNINIDDMEKNLLVVDVAPEEEELKEQISDMGDARPGEPGKEKKPEAEPPGRTERKEEELLTVDQGKGEEKEEEEPKPDAVKTKPAKETKGGSTPAESDSPVYLHAAALQENGVLPNFDLETLKDLEPADALLKINEHIQKQIEDEVKSGVDEYKSSIGEKALDFIKKLEEGVPFEDLAENYTLKERFGSISAEQLEDNVELQEAVYADGLAMKGFSEQKIQKMVALAKESGDLPEESLDSLKDINKAIAEEEKEIVTRAAAAKKDREEKNKEMKEKIQSYVSSQTEVLPDVKLSDADKAEILKSMTTPVRFIEGPQGQKVPVSKAMDLRAKDPIAFEFRLNYLIKAGFFDDDLKNLKLETFLKKQETSASKKLLDKLNGEKKESPVRPVVDEQTKKEDNFVFPQSIASS